MRFSFLLVGGYGPASAIGTCAHEFATGQELNGDHSSGNLNVGVLVQNIAFQKQVGIVYTTDNWLTFQNAFGNHTQSFPPPSTPHQLNAELWNILAPVGVGAKGQYTVFYNVEGTTYWDNNFGLNYSF